MKLLEQQNIQCEQENITGSLFSGINDPKSKVNLLIGSRKFMEGWDSFRVSSMGLMRIGMGEGSQIVQLFGRGVRLWGKDYSLKRSSALPIDETPPNIHLLETLNVFGVRANYMAEFRLLKPGRYRYRLRRDYLARAHTGAISRTWIAGAPFT